MMYPHRDLDPEKLTRNERRRIFGGGDYAPLWLVALAAVFVVAVAIAAIWSTTT